MSDQTHRGKSRKLTGSCAGAVLAYISRQEMTIVYDQINRPHR